MNQYLEVNCQDIVLAKENKSISLTVKGKIKLCVNGKVKQKIVLINSQLLAEKEANYAQMFKSEVVYPSPPFIPQVPIEQQVQQQNRMNVGQTTNMVSQQPDHLRRQQQRPSTNSMSGQTNIFGRSQAPYRQTEYRNNTNQQRRNQNLFESNQSANEWRNRTFTSQNNERNERSSNQNIFTSNQSNYNRGGQNAASNLFASAPTGRDDGPSLFASNPSNNTSSQPSMYNRRNNRNKGPARIS